MNNPTGIDPRLLDEMASDLADGVRNDAAITDEDLLAMEQAALTIDPATCDPAPHGGRFCPRCGHCCTIRLVGGVWQCVGGCDRNGNHAA